jgi:hypothetical protein
MLEEVRPLPAFKVENMIAVDERKQWRTLALLVVELSKHEGLSELIEHSCCSYHVLCLCLQLSDLES